MPNTTATEYLNDLAARMRASAVRQPDDLAAALLDLAAHADRLAADLTPPAPTPAPAAAAGPVHTRDLTAENAATAQPPRHYDFMQRVEWTATRNALIGPAPAVVAAPVTQDPCPPFYDRETGLVVTELGVFGSWHAFYRAQIDYTARALRDAPAAA